LEKYFPDTAGYLVLGPLDPFFNASPELEMLYRSVRVICPDIEALKAASGLLNNTELLKTGKVTSNILKVRKKKPAGFRGIEATIVLNGNNRTVCFLTTQQHRFLLWYHKAFEKDAPRISGQRLLPYARQVSDYLLAIDLDSLDAPEPKAEDNRLPESLDLYPTPPAYVIEGYDNYMDYLFSHRQVKTDFARGILAFIPTDSLINVWKHSAPQTAYPNKEEPMLQQEYRKFFSRSGDIRVMQTLTKDRFSALLPGEYFFAVGLTGRIRFGRELLRAEVDRIESETGKKVPRANHAFLFPGEPVFTAGAFFVEEGENSPRIAEVNAQSGHFFYSNVTPTIREDISLHSDEYLMTLGHFFKELDKLEIPYSSVLIRKF
jgi:hypothetical protein